MSTPSDRATPPSDPFEVWKQIYEANERAWNSALERAMATPAFAESQGKMLETLLAAQKTMRDNMRTYLESINVPTREDIARLGELIVGLEEKVDLLDDRLAGIERELRRGSATAAGPAAARGETGDASTWAAPRRPARRGAARAASPRPAARGGAASEQEG